MPSTLIRSTLVAIALAASAPALAQGQDGSAWQGGFDTYRNNLTRCIARTGACDRGLLSKDDRDYLTYEMKDQRFDKLTATQVVDVRMEYYGRDIPVIRGHATGTRYTSSEPSPSTSAPSSGGGIVGMQGLMTPQNVQAVGGMLAKGLGSVMNGGNG